MLPRSVHKEESSKGRGAVYRIDAATSCQAKAVRAIYREINPQNGSSCASSEGRRGHVDFALSLPLHSSFGTSALCNLRNARFRRSAKTGKRVQIPRCRATVSEDIALGHWEFPGRPRTYPDVLHTHATHPYSRSQETGAIHRPQPLSRDKEDGMRTFAIVVLSLFSATAFAADLTIKVVDPQSAALSGAQVQLIRASNKQVIAVQQTSAEGVAIFHVAAGGSLQVRVLAPGFAVETADVSHDVELSIKLRLATAAETVVVTATRS